MVNVTIEKKQIPITLITPNMLNENILWQKPIRIIGTEDIVTPIINSGL